MSRRVSFCHLCMCAVHHGKIWQTLIRFGVWSKINFFSSGGVWDMNMYKFIFWVNKDTCVTWYRLIRSYQVSHLRLHNSCVDRDTHDNLFVTIVPHSLASSFYMLIFRGELFRVLELPHSTTIIVKTPWGQTRINQLNYLLRIYAHFLQAKSMS